MNYRFCILLLIVFCLPFAASAQGKNRYNIDAKQQQSSADKVKEFYKENKAVRNANKDWHKKHKDRRQVNRIKKKHTMSNQTKEVRKRMKQNEKRANHNNSGKLSISVWMRKRSFERHKKKK